MRNQIGQYNPSLLPFPTPIHLIRTSSSVQYLKSKVVVVVSPSPIQTDLASIINSNEMTQHYLYFPIDPPHLLPCPCLELKNIA